MTDWIGDYERLRDAGEAVVRVTVAGVRGSAPRDVGASMLVMAHEASGTIGGGELEYQCTQIAARLIGDDTAGTGFLRRYPLGTNCGQCCGGVVDILFERMSAADSWYEPLARYWQEREPVAMLTTLDEGARPRKALVTADDCLSATGFAPDEECVQRARSMLLKREPAARIDTPGRGQPLLMIEPVTDSGFEIAVFGAGHVGSAVVQALSGLDCRLRWVDSRRGIFPTRVPDNVQLIECREPAQEVAAMPRRSFFLVMTHSHATDQEICARVLARGDFAYCGLIGSVSKRRRFEKRLRQQGMSEQQLGRLTCPIGIGGITGKQPAEIAVAVAAELLRRRERRAAATAVRGANVHRLQRQQ